ncbi:ATP-binding protein [Xylanimonas sp. McL0601]|uniref:ATP-binding protein n=1 Tax=Xylanimonas sp. McL0601 TaxID=3414739 RepID=UPI003CF01461
MLRRLGVRGKILLTLAMPILVLAVAAGWVSWTSWQTARTASQTAHLVASLSAQDSAGSAFAAERSLNIAASLGIPGAREGLEAAIKQSDAQLDARGKALAAVPVDALDIRVRRAISATLADRSQIDKLQAQILAGTIPEDSATQAYGRYIADALDVARELAGTTGDSTLRQRLDTYVAMDEAMLAMVLERPLVGGVLAGAATGNVDQGLMLRTVATINSTDTQFDAAQKALDRLPGGHRMPPLDGDLGTIRNALSRADFQGVQPAVAAQWSDLTEGWVAAAQPIRDDVRDETSLLAQWLADTQQQNALYTAGGAFGVLALSLIIALAVARRIVNPLRRLTAATGEIRDRLPRMVEQMAVPGQTSNIDLYEIPVESRDEIGRLAQSFNDVNATTVAVAKEQAALRGSIAEMFVNVARRDQVLLNRQLAFLDELERSEEDPSTLSNLFRLDHLATRMRRNAESLLVLAGIDSGRRVRQPMPASDVIRTASSEIELYDRVRLDLHIDPLILGHNALNAAHLLAELLENATMFSEPHTAVEVATARDHRGIVITVRDHGLGMTPEEIADANAKVASRSAQDAVGAQRLGLYVVGRLADRLGAVIAFGTGPDGTGTMVTVVFPIGLFLPDDAVPLPQPTDPLEASTQHAAASLGQAMAFDQVTTAAFGQPAPVAEVQPPTFELQPPAFGSPAPAYGVPTPAFDPTPVAQPEPPVAVQVDLDALTDGTTATGMPRRRTTRGELEPDSTSALVLPPLETPQFAPDLVADEAWLPPSDIQGNERTLPSRQRGEPLPEPQAVSTPVIAVEQRTGLFSSFRALTDLESAGPVTGTLHLGASVEDPAALPAPLTAAPVNVAPAQPVAAVAPATAFEPVAPVAPQPVLPPEPQAPAAFRAPAPVVPTTQFAPVAPASDDALNGDVPAFDALMSDLPSRRATREQHAPGQSARKRGLFGRRPEDEATTAIPVQAADGPAAAAFVAPAPMAPLPASGGGPFAPVTQVPVPPSAAFRAAPALEPYPAPPAPAPLRAFGTGAPAAPPTYEPTQSAGWSTGGATASAAQGGSALPLRAAADPLADPLDPYAIPDTVEARSEWMASAVLYEEMSSLLRRGVFEEQRVTPTLDDAYRPESAAPAEPSGLVRRTSRPTVNPAVDRFTARIERDPEQLRSRLSAFQSATSRGRSMGEDEGPSTWAPAP